MSTEPRMSRGTSRRTFRAFTIIELLVVVSIIALLVGILLPAIGKARDQAKLTISLANLRNLGTAHGSYASEWNDRQYTAVVDSIASYGVHTGEAFDNYGLSNGSGGANYDPGNHPPIYLGYGWREETNEYRMYAYKCDRGRVGNASLTLPIVFEGAGEYFGSFRLPNALNFSQYVSGRFYDPVFYAPKDATVIEAAYVCFESPDGYCPNAKVLWGLGNPAWSSYILSPAGMFNPMVMSHDDSSDPGANGWVDPWEMDGAFRSPSFSQCLYPALKTHMLEHHWLQNPAADCNPGFDPGTYLNGCEPYYFNHAWESSPATLFYDGHVETVGARNTMRADGRMRQQTGELNWGLWSQDTPWGEDGYLGEYGYDQAQTSFHVLTTDGIRGRDILGD